MFTNEFILVENRLVPFWVSDYGACILIHFKIALGYINPIRIFTRLEKLMRFENFSKMIFYFQKLPTETSEKKITVTNRKGTFFILSFRPVRSIWKLILLNWLFFEFCWVSLKNLFYKKHTKGICGWMLLRLKGVRYKM